MTTLYLIRHAEAEGNVFRRIHGQYDSMVTPNGMRQIKALEQRFADIPVDAVYASDLTRTCVTAGAIYKPKALPLHREPRFREVSIGIWEDIPFGQLELDDPARLYVVSHDPEHFSIEGGETMEVYTARFMEALDEVARRHDGQTVAIFSHGMVLRGVMQRLFFPNDPTGGGHCENTGVTCITWENGEYQLKFLNDASHLPMEISTLGRQHWWRGDRKLDFNLRYRPATAEDAAFLQALGHCPEPSEETLLALLGGQPIGAISMRPCGHDAGGIVFLGLLPEHRGKGLAAQLLGCAVSRFRSAGAKRLLLLQQPESDEAGKFFATYGFDGTNGISIVPVIR